MIRSANAITLLLFIFISVYLSASRVSDLFVSTNHSEISQTGHWGPSVHVSLVSVAAAVLPLTGHVLLWAADQADVFNGDGPGLDHTVTAIYDPHTGTIINRTRSNLDHGMFCPGLSMDEHGQPIVTGGQLSNRTSIYSDKDSQWVRGPDMRMGRGYHSQATLSNGNIFTIGGSWSGGVGGEEVALKNGEIFDPALNNWAELPGCKVEPILTQGIRGGFESDNHAWLFAWNNASVFQAGPSKNMNWFGAQGEGTFKPAGTRAHDGDSMNGNAVMYDAVHGKILTLGGASSYSTSCASSASHIITLGAEYELPQVQEIGPMHKQRVYANSVVLPTGDVFINGGATYAMQWTDKNSTWYPEIWSPSTQRFTFMARPPTPRNYHSIAILLPDATVLTGGGGLCWNGCADDTANHLDVQIFTPPYLYESGGRLAARPKILEVPESVRHGEHITATTDTQVYEFTMIRYSSVTHSINTDQRRVPLKSKLIKGPDSNGSGWQYQVEIPEGTGIVTPGYWMLFALDKKGVPSVARTLRI